MVGKNGVSKMVLRKTLPIINAHLTRLLNDICDFNIEIDINEKNEVMFYLIKDNVKSDLISGSGFERTASALALRAVLGNISTLPKINILILDEYFDSAIDTLCVENVLSILKEYSINQNQNIFVISHRPEVGIEQFNRVIQVEKTNGIAHVSFN
jgi:DNA repair exonuclease SbcCD ATPase subunit